MGLLYSTEESSSPSTPAAGKVVLYYKTDGFWYYKDDSGAEQRLVASAQAGTIAVAGSVAGTNTITATTTPSIGSYALGQIILLVPANTNTGATTLNIDSLGAKNIYFGGSALVGSELVAGVPYLLIYDGTQFVQDLGPGSRMLASATVAAHATTMDPWGAKVVTLSGGAVTFTDIADADYVGQTVLLIMNAAHIWTDGAVFDVQGGANYTAAAGDILLITATAVDAFDVTIFNALGPVGVATQTQQEAGTDTVASVTPGRQQYHPSAVKAWLKANGNSTTINSSYNIDSIADDDTGDCTVTITTDFSSNNYGVVGTVLAGGGVRSLIITAQASGTFSATVSNSADVPIDPTNWLFMAAGDQ